MKKYIISLLLVICTVANIYAQTVESGIMGGGMYYLGDINTKSHFKQIKPAAGIMARYNPNDRWAFRFNILKGAVISDDEVIMEVPDRNLKFESPIVEFSVLAEFNFWSYETGNKNDLTPFIFGGVSAFFFQPQGTDPISGEEIALKGYVTEGQVDSTMYNESAFSIPFGIGVKYSLTDRIGLSAEWGLRKTFTDYLDDISTDYYLDAPSLPGTTDVLLSDPLKSHYAGMQRGNPETKDWYAFFGITLTYKINLNSGSCAEF